MLKTSLALLLALAVAIGGGAASLAYVLDDPAGTGALSIGDWTAFPKIGAPDADPYSKARAAREGILALGSAEGVAFTASEDSEGQPLRAECSYDIDGVTPPARFWTLFAQGANVEPLYGTRLPAINSQTILRRADNSFVVRVSPHPAPGNWLGVGGAGPMSLVLTVYDASVVSGTELGETLMPEILARDCGDA